MSNRSSQERPQPEGAAPLDADTIDTALRQLDTLADDASMVSAAVVQAIAGSGAWVIRRLTPVRPAEREALEAQIADYLIGKLADAGYPPREYAARVAAVIVQEHFVRTLAATPPASPRGEPPSQAIPCPDPSDAQGIDCTEP